MSDSRPGARTGRSGLARTAWAALLAALAALQVISAHDVVSQVGAYAFAEGTGTTTMDASGNSNTGTLKNGATWAAGKFGNAAAFDGTNDFVTIDDRPSLQLGRTGTLEAWVYLNNRNRWNGVLGKATGPNDEAHSYALETDTSGRPSCLIGNGITTNSAKSATMLQAKRFYHLACVWDGTQLRLYLDGVLSKSTPQTLTPSANAGPLVIGQFGGNIDYLDGRVDEVRIFNVAVTQANIQLDMTTPVEALPDTVAPVVSLAAPLDAATVSGTVALVANASDDRVVAGVRFFVDGASIGLEDTNTPYSVTWDTTAASNGAHTITATARDATGNSGAAAPRSVTVSNVPKLVITQPASGAMVTGGSINITYAVAGDTTGFAVNHVHFQIDGGPEIMDLPPIDGVKTITDVTTGGHTLTGFLVRADHTKIAGTDSAPVSFTMTAPDAVPPTVAIASPANGASVSGIVTISATAADNVGVAGVQFRIDGINIGSEDPVAPYTLQWNAVGNGPHVVTAVARDASNNQTTSAPISLIVADPNDPAVVGKWSALMNWPLVAVHSTLMPTGEILMWDGWELPNASAKVWNPSTGEFFSTPVGAGVFCAAQAVMSDGRVLVIGGHAGSEIGIPDTFLFDPFTRNWQRAPYMNFSRWYPSATRLGDGRVVAISGQLTSGSWADQPEVFDVRQGQWSVLTGANTGSMHDSEYPLSFLLPDGRLYVVSAVLGQAHLMNVAPNSWSAPVAVPMRNGSVAMYRPGKFLMTGGGSTAAGPSQPTAVVGDPTGGGPAWRSIAPMAYGRYQHNLVVLADGDVLAVGGASIVTTTTNASNGVLPAELWRQSTETWSTMASMQDPRMYHSTALLLPDGRVLAAGGGRLGSIPSFPTAEIYSPPYLFRGARPTITAAPSAAALGDTISIDTPDAAHISRVAVVPLGAVTHTLNMNQTYVEVPFSVSGTTLQAQLPTNSQLLPPGYYMLFVLNEAGVPALAPFIRLVDPSGPVDAVPPSVTITAPASGATVSGTLPVSADATDAGGVANVQFRLDGFALAAADTTAPYGFSWNTAASVDGAHVLSAVARDAAGNVSTVSQPVTILNGSTAAKYLGHPVVGGAVDAATANSINASRFVMPTENGTSASISVYVAAPIGAAPNNQFQLAVYSDQNGLPGTLIASTASRALTGDAWNTVPLSVALSANTAYWLAYNTNATSSSQNNPRFDAGTVGQWQYRSQAFGTWPAAFGSSAGASASQASVFLTYFASGSPPDATPPSVSISAPGGGATLAGVVNVDAAAADNVGVASVQFQLDGADLGAADTSAPYSTSWNTTGAQNGTHLLTATARDLAGNVTTSTGVTVTVANGTGTTRTLGFTAIGATADDTDSNHINTWRFVMPSESGTATSLSVYINGPIGASPNNQFQVAVYADTAGAPGALLVSSASATIAANAWNTVPLTLALQPNTAYWLAYNTNGTSAAVNNIRFSPGVAGQARWRAQAFGTWVSTFGTPSGSSASQASIYLTYKVP